MSVFTDCIQAIHAELADASVAMRLGRAELSRNDQIRRVVWVRETSPVLAAEETCGNLAGTNRQRSAYTLEMRASVYVFAESDTTAELLMANILVAGRQVLATSFKPTSVSYPTDEPAYVAGATGRCAVAVISLGMSCPVRDELKALTPIESFDTTCELEDPTP